MAKNKKGIRSVAGLTILAITLTICLAGSFLTITLIKSNLAKQEAKLPDSAISIYLKQVKANDFDGIYENSLIIDSHLNSKEDYSQAIQNIYKDVDVNKVIYVPVSSKTDDILYNLYENDKKISTLKLIQANNGKWLASTLFQGDHSYKIEAPAGVEIQVNGFVINDKYMKEKNVSPTNFSGLNTDKYSPSVVQYELNNLISEPEITINNDGYDYIKDVLSNTYYVGKSTTDSILEDTFINAAKTCARYPTKDGTLGAIAAITITDSDFYEKLKTMDNQWYAAHGTSQFSNEAVLKIIQQDENTMIGNVIFDYYIASGSTSKEYNCGYQITFANVNGKWKIAGFAIDNEMNPKTITYQ